jgi:hypothetical protein
LYQLGPQKVFEGRELATVDDGGPEVLAARLEIQTFRDFL